jgi:hypothetical protein
MKKFIASKTEKEILKTHPISSTVEGWFIKVEEISNNAFVVEAIDCYGRCVSKQGNDPNSLRKEVENLIK